MRCILVSAADLKYRGHQIGATFAAASAAFRCREVLYYFSGLAAVEQL